jgi:hypothetical protein
MEARAPVYWAMAPPEIWSRPNFSRQFPGKIIPQPVGPNAVSMLGHSYPLVPFKGKAVTAPPFPTVLISTCTPLWKYRQLPGHRTETTVDIPTQAGFYNHIWLVALGYPHLPRLRPALSYFLAGTTSKRNIATTLRVPFIDIGQDGPITKFNNVQNLSKMSTTKKKMIHLC